MIPGTMHFKITTESGMLAQIKQNELYLWPVLRYEWREMYTPELIETKAGKRHRLIFNFLCFDVRIYVRRWVAL